MKTKRMVFKAILIAIGVVISPIFRVVGFAPMQHVINVIGAVFLFPTENFTVALLIGIIRMFTMGVPPLAITGAIFGAYLSAYFYKRTHKFYMAAIGEVIGTGIIGSMISYPVMKFVVGDGRVSLFYYTPSFVAATVIGSLIALIFLKALESRNLVNKFKTKLNS